MVRWSGGYWRWHLSASHDNDMAPFAWTDSTQFSRGRSLAVARSSVHPPAFRAFWHVRTKQARARTKALLFFSLRLDLQLLAIYAFFTGGCFAERLFCASSNRLARAHYTCSDHLLLLPSSVSLDCFVEFRTCAIASSRTFRLRHQTKKKKSVTGTSRPSTTIPPLADRTIS